MVAKKIKQKKKLGTGLSSLLVKDEELSMIVKKPLGRPSKKTKPGEYKRNLKPYSLKSNDSNSLIEIATHLLVPGKFQPRKDFNIQEIEELAESIRQNGILQPILVRPLNSRGKSYEIIAGERRWRAAQLAKLHQVPVIIRKFDDETSLGVALVENLQRSDLNLLEEAQGYRLLMNKFEYTQEKLSHHLGKSRSHIANLLRLLSLPQNIKSSLVIGDLTYGHVRAVLTLKEDDANEIVSQIIDKGLSVRETEKIVKKFKSPKSSINIIGHNEVDPNISFLEKELTLVLGLKVTVTSNSKNKGYLSIHYNSVDQLDPIIDKLRWQPK
ncbi:ParB/RepB/Spo0J family partition protein [Rickettsiales bacterium]|nr:ParB/RepB/Spo0J family partition protein [Rickettsiales bacterium]